MKKLLLLSVILIGQFTFAQDENILDNLIDDAKSLINNVDLDNILPEYQYEFGVLWIKNENMRSSKRTTKKGMVWWEFLSSKDGDRRLNNISPTTKGWNLVAGEQGNEMKVIADKLNEGWEIVDFEILYQTAAVGGVTMYQNPEEWIVHMKRKVKK
jgi:hypothetical protein